MLKKMGLMAALLGSSMPSCAMDGFYVGLGVGPEYANFSKKASFQRPPNNVTEKIHLSGTGVVGSVFAGYERCFALCDCSDPTLSLAAELNYDASTLQYKESNNEYTNQNFNFERYKLGRSIGISLLPGYMISECTVLYARVGYVNRDLNVITTEVTLPSLNKNRPGFRYGIGIKQFVCNNFAVRLDYSQSQYKKVHIFGVDNRATKFTSIAPYASKFELALVYNFM